MLPGIAVILFVLFQFVITWWLWRSSTYERAEKIAQTKLIWFLPFLGAALVGSMLWDETRHET